MNDLKQRLASWIADPRTGPISNDLLDLLRDSLTALEEQESKCVQMPEMCVSTQNLVIRFATALAEKLAAAEKKYGYGDSWQTPDAEDWPDPKAYEDLVKHLTKGDPRDVAIYCAFLWHHGLSTKRCLEPLQQRIEEQERQIEEVRNAVDAGPNCSTIEAVLGTIKAYESCAGEKRQLEQQLRESEASCATMRGKLGLDTEWPLHDVLDQCRLAIEHMMQVHDCDHEGHELYSWCAEMAKGYYDSLKQLDSIDAGKAMLERLQAVEEERDRLRSHALR